MTTGELHVVVNVSDKGAFPVSLMERAVLFLGGPPRVLKLCDVLAWVFIAMGLAYVVTWETLYGVIGLLDRPTSWSPIQITVLSLGGLPIISFQVLTGSLRYGAVSLLMKQAEHLPNATINGFHARVGEAVSEALAEHERERAQAPPTIQ